MRSYDIEELMEMDWVPDITQEEDGKVTLRIQGLPGFVLRGHLNQVLAAFPIALESHLASHLAKGKAVPVPEGRVVQDSSRTCGDTWQYLDVNALTGRTRTWKD